MTTQKPRAYSYLRFSNPKQKKGDSSRRQNEAAQKYAKENGLELDKTLNMKDEGLSGFQGKHIEEGNLGKFLALIKAGKITPGSRLIVESIDRLGRQEPLTATDVIKLILRAGIMLVVLDYNRVREFTDKSIRNTPGEYSGLVAEIERAYFESKRKSEQLKATWKEKRKKARNEGKKLTRVCPLWLELSEDKKKFIEIPERVEAVNEIFKLKADGLGNGRIAEELNENPDIWQPPKSNRNKTGGWPTSTIQRILNEKRVLGEYQPHKKIDGKRQPVGDPIKDYYPAVVDEDLFYAVQNRLSRWQEKHGHPGGRADKATNVFTHVAKCGKCGNPMHYRDKGAKGKQGGYLRCYLSLQPQRATDGETCNTRSIYYTDFKETFFKYVTEIKVSDIMLNADEHQEQIEELNETIDANGERILELEQKEDNLTDSIAEGDSPELRQKLKQRLGQIISERKDLAQHTQQLVNQRTKLKKQAAETQATLNTLEEVQKLEQAAKTEKEAVEIRRRIRAAIKQLVDSIEIYPSTKTTGKYDKVIVWFNGAEPHAHSLTFRGDEWRKLTRMKAQIKSA